MGVPFSQFHGGFGLVAQHCIPKPTFWSFAFFKKLKNFSQKCIYRDDTTVIVADGKGGYAGVVWNFAEKDNDFDIEIAGKVAKGDKFTVITETVDEKVCNPLKIWHDLGEPKYPSDAEAEIIKKGSMPLVESDVIEAAAGKLALKLKMGRFGVKFFIVKPLVFDGDAGYDYNKIEKISMAGLKAKKKAAAKPATKTAAKPATKTAAKPVKTGAKAAAKKAPAQKATAKK